jgi:hypothetical protein
MSKFLTEMEVENATALDDGNWRLIAPLVYQSDVAGQTFTVPAGFVTNFASVPRAPVVYMLCGGTSNEAAALHDFLYTAPHPVTRPVADAVLREASAVTGVAAWRRYLMWAGVRVFGASHWDVGASIATPASKAA